MKLLILAQTPPPIHGAAIINQAVKDVVSRAPGVQVKHVDTSASKTILDMQRSPIIKLISSFSVFARSCLAACSQRKKIAYINTSPSGITSCRDLALIVIASLRSRFVFAHFHGQIADNSVFLKKATQRILKKNIAYVFLDESLVPSGILSGDRDVHFLRNFAPEEELYRTALAPTKSKKTVAFLSNMLPAKGIVEFLEVCASALRSGQDFLVIIGGGWTLKYTEQEYSDWLDENADVSGSFFHFGAVNADTKIPFFSQADIFLYPTHNDAFPLVLLEAMASRTAIIASDVGAIRTIVSDDELIFPSDDRSRPAKILLALLGNEDFLEEKKTALQSRYYSEFSRERFETKLLQILGIGQ